MGRKRGFYRTAIYNTIEIEVRRTVDLAGSLNLGLVKDRVADWLGNQPSIMADQKRVLAAMFVNDWDQEQRPGPGGGQYGLFEPRKLIPYERNFRVYLEYASLEQIEAWDAIERAEYRAQTAAYEAKQQFRNDLIFRWTGPDRQVMDVMSREYGYVKPSQPWWLP